MPVIYVAHQGQQQGPLTAEEVRKRLTAGLYHPDTLAWQEGTADWVPLRQLFPETERPEASVPPPLPPEAGFASVHAPAAERLGDSAGMRLLLPVGRSGWAIAAGYLGLFALLVVPAPLALIASLIAIRDIRASKGGTHPKHGMGRAVFGLLTGLLGTGLLVTLLVVRLAGKS